MKLLHRDGVVLGVHLNYPKNMYAKNPIIITTLQLLIIPQIAESISLGVDFFLPIYNPYIF